VAAEVAVAVGVVAAEVAEAAAEGGEAGRAGAGGEVDASVARREARSRRAGAAGARALPVAAPALTCRARPLSRARGRRPRRGAGGGGGGRGPERDPPGCSVEASSCRGRTRSPCRFADTYVPSAPSFACAAALLPDWGTGIVAGWRSGCGARTPALGEPDGLS